MSQLATESKRVLYESVYICKCMLSIVILCICVVLQLFCIDCCFIVLDSCQTKILLKFNVCKSVGDSDGDGECLYCL